MPTSRANQSDGAPPRSGIVVGSLVATFAMIALASLVPHARDARLWGINHLAYYPLPVRLAALGLMALAFVPALAHPVHAGLLRLTRALGGGGRRAAWVVAAVSVASTVVFFAFRSASYLLGDGQLIVQSFEASYLGNDSVIMSSVATIFGSDFISPGTTLLYYWTVKLAVVVFGLTPTQGLVVLPCLLGGGWVFLVLRLSGASVLTPALRAWILVLGLFTTSAVVFFGYIENYSVLLIVVALYAVASFRVLHRAGRIWIPVALFVAAVFVHIQAVLLVPSLVFLVAWRAALGRRRVVLRWGVPVLVSLLLLVTVVARAFQFPGDLYLPLFANDASYGLLSPGHLLDAANELLMLLPILPFVAAAWFVGRRGVERSQRKGSEGDRWFGEPVEWQLVALLIVPCLVYIAFFRSEIGMARDWDLFTMTSVGGVALVLLAVNRYSEAVGGDAARVSVPALVMVAVMGVAWIGINASSERTPERFESIFAYDQTHAGYAYENLAAYYHDRGRLGKAIRAMENGARLSGNPRLYARLAFYYEDNGDIAGAIRLLYEMLESHPEYYKGRAKLLDLLEKARRWDELVQVARGGVEHSDRAPLFYFALGEGLIRTGKVDEGLDAFRKCLSLNPPQSAQDHIRKVFEQFGREP